MRALFCTDGSKISYDALRNASHWIDKSIVTDTICVIDWSFLPDEVVIEDSGFTTSCRNIADEILDYSKTLINETGLIAGEKIKHCGAAVESIIEQINSREYDIIIMGSHGKKGIQMWLGSVSREILEATKVPVYISKENHAGKRVLFTTDGSEVSYNIIKKAISILNLQDKEVYLCTVTENPDLLFLEGTLDTNWLMAIQTQQEIYSEKALNTVRKLFQDEGIEIRESEVLTGVPAQSIINYGKEKGIDLIISGSKTKTRMQSFLLDSTSKRVIENSKSDTLVIREE